MRAMRVADNVEIPEVLKVKEGVGNYLLVAVGSLDTKVPLLVEIGSVSNCLCVPLGGLHLLRLVKTIQLSIVVAAVVRTLCHWILRSRRPPGALCVVLEVSDLFEHARGLTQRKIVCWLSQ